MEQNTTGGATVCREIDRLAKLESYDVHEKYEKIGVFQHVASMAAQIFNTPIAVVTFIDEQDILIKAGVGVDGVDKICRPDGLCSTVIMKDEVTVYENTLIESCLIDHPMVYGSFGLRFYAGAPLITPEGYRIGTVSIGDFKPREFPQSDRMMLESLAAVVIEELENRLVSY